MEKLWNSLKKHNIFRLKSRYPDSAMMDGNYWTLKFKAAGQTVESRGQDNIPDRVGKILSAINEFARNIKKDRR